MIANGEPALRRPRLDRRRPTSCASSAAAAGSSRATPEELPDELLRGAELAMAERPSWEADVPLEALAAAGFPVLAISGGHSPVFEAVCDTIAERLGGERSMIEGKGHNVPETGAPYNERLERFLDGL